MNSSIRGWMLSLSLTAIVAGSARAQSPPKAAETKVQTPGLPTQGDATKLGHAVIDFERNGAVDLFVANASNPHGMGGSCVACHNMPKHPATAFQPSAQWLSRLGNDDVGAELTPVDAALRAQLNLPQAQGLVVTGVVADGRAAKVGLKANDILLTLGGTSLTQPIDFLNVLKAQTTGIRGNESIELAYLRGGKPASVKIKAEVRVALAAATAAEETPDYYIGTPSNPLDETFRAHLDVPAGTGLVVGEIVKGTPAAKAGVKLGDIVLTFAGAAVPDVEALRSMIQATGPHPAKLDVLRAGKPLTLTITPEARKAEISWTRNRSDSEILFDKLAETTPLGRDFQVNTTVNDRFAPTTHSEVFQFQRNPNVLVFGSAPLAPADLTKKIDELTAQVQALMKAIEGLKGAQPQGGEKK